MITKKTWFVIITLGFIGQLAWMLENMYLNVYLYNVLKGSPKDIAWMVALSAITATLTTIFMGSLSDKLGKRKEFIVGGYFLWGLSVLAFSLINHEFLGSVFPFVNVVSMSVFLLILWDCVMTFLGSTANDAAYNAWITDTVSDNQRGKVETVLAILPLMAMLLIFGLLDPLTQNNQWTLFFSIIGIIVFIGGLIALVMMKDSAIQKSNASLKDTLIMGFKAETILSNKKLYLSFLLLMVVSIATQIWMPYLIIYIQKTLLINDYALILGVVLISASIISVLVGRLIKKSTNIKFLFIGLIVQIVGLVLMSQVVQPLWLMIGGTILMSGNMILIAISNGLIRDYTPQSMAGRFQGVRMIFGVMIPMIIGPMIGSMVISNSNQTYEELGVIKQVPTPMIFIVSIFVLILMIYPTLKLKEAKDGTQ